MVLSLVVMFGLSMTALAQVTIHFTGPTESSYGGVGTGLYAGTVNGNPATFFCDDYPDHITYGESWQANVSSLASLGAVRFPNPGGVPTLQAYSEVAWLAENLLTGMNKNGSGVTDPDTISFAIWSILYPFSPPVGAGPAPGTANAIADAQSWWGGLSSACQTIAASCVDNVLIYTPVQTQNGPQEFVGTVPEPLSMALMGTFLSLAGVALRKKKLLS